VIQLISKTMQSKVKESLVVGPHTRMEPANESHQQLTDDLDVQDLYQVMSIG